MTSALRVDPAILRAEAAKTSQLAADVKATEPKAEARSEPKPDAMTSLVAKTAAPLPPAAASSTAVVRPPAPVPAATPHTAAGRLVGKNITLADAIGEPASKFDLKTRKGKYAWNDASYPTAAKDRRNLQIKVQRAMHEGMPVIMTWFVDFNAMDSQNRFMAPPATPGRQGGHMTVVEDYQINDVPGYGTLKAETSESRSLGVVWSPDYLGDFQFSVDYFDIIVEGEVGRVTNAYILRQCYDSPNFPNEPLCNLFTRKQPGELPPGPIKEIYNNYLNIAAQTSRGIDFEAHYGLDIPWGDLDFTLRASRQLENGEQLLPGSAFEDNNGENGEPEWVGNLNTTFTSGPFSVNWGLRYVDATSNLDDFTEANPNQPYTFLGEPVLYVLSTPPRFYHSLSVGYDFESLGVSARFGVRNVFDETPPITSSNAGYLRQGNSVIESQYDLYGRTWFINLSKAF